VLRHRLPQVGQAVGAAAASYTIGLGGYVSGAASQPETATHAIGVAAGVVPAVFFVGAIAAISAYPLTQERFRRLVAELAQHRSERDLEEQA
jgi:glucuronide carrier protein